MAVISLPQTLQYNFVQAIIEISLFNKYAHIRNKKYPL